LRYGLICLLILDFALVTLHILYQAYKALCDEHHRWVLGVAPFDSSKEQPSIASVLSANAVPSSLRSDPTAAGVSFDGDPRNYDADTGNFFDISDESEDQAPEESIRSRALREFSGLYESQLTSLETIDEARAMCSSEHRIATAAIVTPTGSGKDMLPLVWARMHKAVSIIYVPYKHLVETVQQDARKKGFRVEKFVDVKGTNNSNADAVVCAYEHAPATTTLIQNLNKDQRLAGLFENEAHVLDDKLDGGYREFKGTHQLMGILVERRVNCLVVFMSATLRRPDVVLEACGLRAQFDRGHFLTPMRRNLRFHCVQLVDGTSEQDSHRNIMNVIVETIRQLAPSERVCVFVMCSSRCPASHHVFSNSPTV
jgi:hypothetical protein